MSGETETLEFFVLRTLGLLVKDLADLRRASGLPSTLPASFQLPGAIRTATGEIAALKVEVDALKAEIGAIKADSAASRATVRRVLRDGAGQITGMVEAPA